MTVVWREEDASANGTLPRLITMPGEAHREFLSWAYTYLSILRPLTAYVRLLDPLKASGMRDRGTATALGRFSEAFIGAIIGEAVSYLGLRPESLHQLTSNASANSHAYALTRVVALGLRQWLDEVSSAWSLVRELTGHAENHVPDAKHAVAILSGLRARQYTSGASDPELPLLEQACWEIADAGDIGDDTWSTLTAPWGSTLLKIRAQMAGSRENRVRAFDRASAALADNPRVDRVLASFVSGYLGSRIAPGELDHLNIAARTLETAPSALLWFGVCSGLRSDGQILAFGGGLGRRILRDLEEGGDVLDRPRCDLAITELDVLLNREKPLTDFRPGSNALLTVELAPGVVTAVRWPKLAGAQAELFPSRVVPFEVQLLIRDLSTALDRVDSIQRRLERAVDQDVRAVERRTEPKPRKRY
jgi:hypothetical protein